MASRKRARLTEENDPLTQTDQVLAGFEQVSQSASQEAGELTSQPDDKTTSFLDENPDIQEDGKTASQEVNQSVSQKPGKFSGQEVDLLVSQEVNKSTFQQVKDSIPQRSEQSTRSRKSDSQQVSKSTSQPVDKSAIRKATFQISEEVLGCLDTFHLKLQLELGKGNAPYKEVIVEEAISRFLAQVEEDREKAIDSLRTRQIKRY